MILNVLENVYRRIKSELQRSHLEADCCLLQAEAGEEEPTPAGAPTSTSTSVRMSSEISTEGEDAWRNLCYEHPLHAATSAMLNLNGVASLHEDQTVSILYGNYYKNSSSNAPTGVSPTDKDDIGKTTAQELWP